MDRRAFNKLAGLAGVGVLTGQADLYSLITAQPDSSEFNSGDANVDVPSEPEHVRSLNGTWRFKLENRPAADSSPALEPFQTPQYSEDKEWTNLNVPGNWEMAGFSPASYNEPDEASGLYRLWFEVPKSWEGRIVRLAFDGVQNGAEIWLNGEPVAVGESSWGRNNYHESGWTAFQVDLTPQVKFGTRNLLALRVTKKTRSSQLDSGDYFFLGGIHRPVMLFSVPKTHFADLTVQTRIVSSARAEVKALVGVAGNEAATAFMQIDGVGGKVAAKVENGHALLIKPVEQPKLWSAEFPNLYSLTLELKDAHGRTIETITKRIGIREVTVKNGVLLVNGVPVKLAGICRHDVSPSAGTAVGPDLWRKDITMMKAANINAIRTSHYPYGTGFYDLCDELGMYVVDELPYCWCPTDTPELRPAFEQRARETVHRDKNHPSVIAWTIGNENKPGRNLQFTADLVKQLEPTRPRAVSCIDGDEYKTEFSDSHYPSLKKMVESAELSVKSGHPHIFLEQPNTWDIRLAADAGAWERWGPVLQRVWDICLKYDTIPGTFLWEWQDRAVADQCPKKLYTYFPETGIQLKKIKGLVDGFRNPRPWVYDVKMIYSPVQVISTLKTSKRQVSFPVENRYSFTDLSQLKFFWALERDQKTIHSGSIPVHLVPRSRGDVTIPLSEDELAQADALRIEFSHPAGHNIVTHRFVLRDSSSSRMMPTPPDLAVPEFNLVTRLTVKDPATWRKITRFPARLANVVAEPASAAKLTEFKQLTADVLCGDATQVVGHLHAEFENGSFSYRLEWTGAETDVQEIGWSFQMPDNCDHFSWNRDARWTWYPEHHIGRPAGTATPDSMKAEVTRMDRADAFDFNSTKYDCNWATLTDASGAGLRVEFNPQQRFHCRGGIAEDGHKVLVVNQQVNPPEDISSSLVRDLYLKLKPGDIIKGAFRIGSNQV